MGSDEQNRYLMHLNDTLAMENALLGHLEKRLKTLPSETARQRVAQHLQETRGHRDTVKHIINDLGGTPTTTRSHVQSPVMPSLTGRVVDALQAEKGDALLFEGLADFAVEKFEAGIYQTLALIARRLRHQEHAAQFDHIRQQEEAMAAFLWEQQAVTVSEAFAVPAAA